MGGLFISLIFGAQMGPYYATRLSLDTYVGYDTVQPGTTSEGKCSGFDDAVATLMVPEGEGLMGRLLINLDYLG